MVINWFMCRMQTVCISNVSVRHLFIYIHVVVHKAMFINDLFSYTANDQPN